MRPELKEALADAQTTFGALLNLVPMDERNVVLAKSMLSILDETNVRAMALVVHARLSVEWHGPPPQCVSRLLRDRLNAIRERVQECLLILEPKTQSSPEDGKDGV